MSNEQIHKYKYTNTAYDEVPERPNMWYIFEKRIFQGYQKLYTGLSVSRFGILIYSFLFWFPHCGFSLGYVSLFRDIELYHQTIYAYIKGSGNIELTESLHASFEYILE